MKKMMQIYTDVSMPNSKNQILYLYLMQ